jgi:hypothetical protein
MCLKQTTFLGYMYSVAAVLYLQSVLYVMLFPMLNMFCTFTSALPTVCSAQYGCFLQLLNFALSRSVAQVLSQPFSHSSSPPIITAITVVCTVHTRSVSTVQSLYFSTFSAPLLIIFLPPHITSHHITTSITAVCTVHPRSDSTVQSLYFSSFSAPLLITFLSPHITSHHITSHHNIYHCCMYSPQIGRAHV